MSTAPHPPVDSAATGNPPAGNAATSDAASANAAGGAATGGAAAGSSTTGDPRAGGGGVDQGLLVGAVGDLARAATGDFTVDGLLFRLCEVAAGAVGADGAGVMVLDGTRARFAGASTPLLLPVGQVQELLQTGPCHDALVTGEPVHTGDIAEGGRWPRFAGAAAGSGLAAVLVVPLCSRGRSWGTLDLYRTVVGDWTPQQLAAGRLLADVAVSYVVMATDRDLARAAQAQLAHRVSHDPVTGLANRVLLFDRIEHALTRAVRQDTAVAVVFLDLDRFKHLNDTFGHTTGDTVLAVAAHRMAGALRGGDTVARLAGDEFVVVCEDLLRHTPHPVVEQVQAVVDRVLAALAVPVDVDGIEVVLTASAGAIITTDPPTDQTPAGLLHAADAAMYQAKTGGGGQLVIADHDDTGSAGSVRRHELQRDLPHALDRAQLRVYYQPIRSATTGQVTAVEALLRWDHPRHGLLTAGEFIALAELTGTLTAIDSWVITQACAQLAGWRRDLPDHAPRVVFVNVDPHELTDPHLQEVITAALAAHHLTPADLGLEILEARFADPLLAPALTGWQQRGHPLSIDDFGTGYSSLSRLVSLPVAYAKIDRNIVEHLPTAPRSRALVDAVLTIGHTLGLQIIGEGVETDTQQTHLTAAGCDLLQGYHLGPPAPAHDITTALTPHR